MKMYICNFFYLYVNKYCVYCFCIDFDYDGMNKNIIWLEDIVVGKNVIYKIEEKCLVKKESRNMKINW